MMVRTQVQLTEHQSQMLKAIAASRGLSVADLVRQAVDTLLANQPMISMEERRRRAIAAAGKFNSGLPDVGTNHDHYLAEAYADVLR
jgi:Arc/MetJ-type ribon-helix-helix transcriptional regulator